MKPARVRTKAEAALIDSYAALAPGLPGREMVRAARDQAFAAFTARGLPDRHVEEWKYTDLAGRLKEMPPQPLEPAVLPADELSRALGAFADWPAARLVFVDGWYAQEHSSVDVGTARNGVRATALSRTDADDHLARGSTAADGGLTALVGAFATDGAVVALSRAKTGKSANTAAAQGAEPLPLMLVTVATGRTPARTVTRHFVDIGAGERVQLLEIVLQLGEAPSLTVSEIEIGIGRDAEVEHLRVLLDGRSGPVIATARTAIGAGARYTLRQLAAGMAFCRAEADIRLEGEGAAFSLAGAGLCRGREHLDTTVTVDHLVPACTSRELYKCVLAEEARAVFQGKVIVRPDAQKSDGKQMAKALMLSPSVEFDSKPELEIYADDVVCGHGSTAAELDEEQVFYLGSRGIPRPEAKAMLTEAFVAEAFDGMPEDGLAEATRATVAGRLAALTVAVGGENGAEDRQRSG